ncbi:hypothetical protein M422DRAFT_263885 [Sphaerobolus stellatus SS14]|uniref:Uncharacterized protein n=1 Tax=Sphaerobolus stellatus (strain SS14) TaxID=990650 RepID=A0A0C9UXQ9_SPHS4|nr:hypothetical protein M422DRAFT_263885 [Sphaerobolus stellatus SS14]
MQERSGNIVVYECSQRAVVEYGYPASLLTFEAIVPTRIIAYFERHRVALECFCGLESEDPVYLELRNTLYGAVRSCHRCGCHVHLRGKYQTLIIAAHYEGYNRRSAIRPAAAPHVTIPAAMLNPSVMFTHHMDAVSRVLMHLTLSTIITALGKSRHQVLEVLGQEMNIATLQPMLFILFISLIGDILSSPPPASRANNQANTPGRSPSRFMSLASPTSSQASGLIHYDSGMAGSSSSSKGPDGPLEFCDTCFASYPVADFSSHVCILSN